MLYHHPNYGQEPWLGHAYYSRALHIACCNKNAELVKALIQHGANVNYLDYYLKHPLEFQEMGAARNPKKQLEKVASLEVIYGILIAHGALPGYINIRENAKKPGFLPASVEGGRYCGCLGGKENEYFPETRKQKIQTQLKNLEITVDKLCDV